MPNRFQRNSIGELVCRVPLNRGSLLKSIENLVKTIETSENAVMIPTLLRDKVRVDAWELLFVAKILKASILGHDDLVEFYMNHIHQNGLSTTSNGTSTQSAAQTPTQPPVSQLTTPNGGEPPVASLSPSLLRQQSSPATMASSPLLTNLPNATTADQNATINVQPKDQQQDQTATATSSHHSSGSFSSASSQTSSTATSTTTTGGGGGHNNQTGQTTTTTKSSSASWITASQQQSNGSSLVSGNSPFGSSVNSSNSSTASSVNATNSTAATTTNNELVGAPTIQHIETSGSTTPQMTNLATPLKLAPEEGLLAARPLMARLAQPPSLLQLTTTNNHINSVSEMLTSSPLDPSLDLLSQHLIALQQQQQAQQQAQSNNGFELGAGLSLTIPTNGLTADQNQNQTAAVPPTTRHELRSSRSAGCLFRANSGASSPRTPATPYPQAETLAGSANHNGLIGDPTSLVKLLLQVEQLKASIVHVNTLLDSVVDLYKKSIDNISQ